MFCADGTWSSLFKFYWWVYFFATSRINVVYMFTALSVLFLWTYLHVSNAAAACIPQLKISKKLPNGAPCASLASPISEASDHEMPTSMHLQPSDAPTSYGSACSTSVLDFSANSCLSPLASPTESAPSKNSVCNTNSKVRWVRMCLWCALIESDLKFFDRLDYQFLLVIVD